MTNDSLLSKRSSKNFEPWFSCPAVLPYRSLNASSEVMSILSIISFFVLCETEQLNFSRINLYFHSFRISDFFNYSEKREFWCTWSWNNAAEVKIWGCRRYPLPLYQYLDVMCGHVGGRSVVTPKNVKRTFKIEWCSLTSWPAVARALQSDCEEFQTCIPSP